MFAEIFKAVLIMSAVGSLLSVVVLVLKPAIERILGFKWQYYMWLAVILVMICPMKFENDIQLPDPVARGVQNITVREISSVSVFEDASGVYMSKPELQNNAEPVDWVGIAAKIWCAVAVLLFLRTAIGDLLLKHRLFENSVLKGSLGRAEVRECNEAGAPLLLGVIRPVLYIPGEIWDTPRMEYIADHEKIHLKRGDICIKWIVALVKCIHWFNPFVYIVSKQLNTACEVSCDGAATKDMDDAQKREYMQTILEISEREIDFRGSLAAGLSSGGKYMKKRFVAIRSTGKVGWLRGIAGILLIVLTAGYSVYAVGVIRGGEISLDEPEELFLVMPKTTAEQDNHNEKFTHVDEKVQEAVQLADNERDNPKILSEDEEGDRKKVVGEKSSEQEPGESDEAKNKENTDRKIESVNSERKESVAAETALEMTDNAPDLKKKQMVTEESESVRMAEPDKNDTNTTSNKTTEADRTETGADVVNEKKETDGAGTVPEPEVAPSSEAEQKPSPVRRGEFNSEGGDTRQISGVTADETGKITLGIRSNTQETVDVYISDAESDKPLHSMGLPVPYEAAYVMEGLEPGKEYDIVLKGTMRNDWNIESEYVIY